MEIATVHKFKKKINAIYDHESAYTFAYEIFAENKQSNANFQCNF